MTIFLKQLVGILFIGYVYYKMLHGFEEGIPDKKINETTIETKDNCSNCTRAANIFQKVLDNNRLYNPEWNGRLSYKYRMYMTTTLDILCRDQPSRYSFMNDFCDKARVKLDRLTFITDPYAICVELEIC